MSEDLQPRHSSHAGRWALWVTAVLLVYVLSIGPMSALVNLYPPSETGWKVIDTVYQPLIALDKRTTRGRLLPYEVWWENQLGAESFLYQRRPGGGPVSNLIW